MPYWCWDCGYYFSVRAGTPMARSNVSLWKWAIAIYLCVTSLKSISSVKLHRDIGVSQPAAWFMLRRMREAGAAETDDSFERPAEVDETYVGGKRRDMSDAKRKELKGRRAVGKTTIVGVKDRATNQVAAKVGAPPDKSTLQESVTDHADPEATVYTDGAAACKGIPRAHQAVKRSVKEYVHGHDAQAFPEAA